MASILVGWLQLATGACVCYLAVKYVTLKIKNKNKSLTVNILFLDIKYMTLFGVTVQEIDLLRRKHKFCIQI